MTARSTGAVLDTATKGSPTRIYGSDGFARSEMVVNRQDHNQGFLHSNLHRLGVQDKVIQGILRHSTVTMTQNAYIKTVSADAAAAMKTIEAICAANYATNMQPGTEKEPVSTTQ